MIKINFKDGTTLDLNLFNQQQLNDYKHKLKNDFFRNRISGMSIYQNKQLYTIIKPNIYKTLKWECGKIAIAKLIENQKLSNSKDVGESISLIIDDKIKHILTYYFSNKMIKTNIQMLDSIRGT